MASKTGNVSIVIRGKDNISPTLNNVSKKYTSVFAGLQRTTKLTSVKIRAAFKRIGSGIDSIIKKVVSWKSAFVALAVYGIARVIGKWNDLFAIQEKAEAGMTQAMQSMGRYTEHFHAEILKTASALQKMSTFGDEAIIMGAKFLMTYEGISDDIMPRVMKTMTDVAALMKGDFVSAANMLGKASMGMIGELRRIGITVDSETYKLEGFEGVLRQIERQVYGQAEALRKTKSGGIESFWNTVSDVWEKFGAFTMSIGADIADYLQPLVEELNEKLAAYIGSGDMERDAKRWSGLIIEGGKKIYDEAIKPLIEGMKDFIRKWDESEQAIKKFVSQVSNALAPVRWLWDLSGKIESGLNLFGKVDDFHSFLRGGDGAAGSKQPPSPAPSGSAGGSPAKGSSEYWKEWLGKGGTSTNIVNNFNGKMSRSDVVNINKEQARTGFREGWTAWSSGAGGSF